MRTKRAYYGGYPVSRPREIQRHGESDVDRTDEERRTADSNGQHDADASRVTMSWLDSPAGDMQRKKKRQLAVERKVRGKADPASLGSLIQNDRDNNAGPLHAGAMSLDQASSGNTSDSLGMVHQASANLRALAKKPKPYKPYRDAVTYQGEDKMEAGVLDSNEDSQTNPHQIRSRNPGATTAGRSQW